MPTALVTGSGVRVGRAIASALLAAGHDLVLHVHRSVEGASGLVSEAARLGRKAEVVAADLTDSAGIDKLATTVRRFAPGLDVLVNSAAGYAPVPFDELTPTAYREMLALNLDAPLFLTKALLPQLRRAQAPCVINITDAHLERPYGGYAHYFVSKAGLAMLTQVLAIELAPQVRVCAIAPGSVAFPDSFSEAKRKSILKTVPLGREGSPEDIARAVVFLVRDGTYITGETLRVDGGVATA